MRCVMMITDGVVLLWDGLWICAVLLQAGEIVRVLWCSLHVVCESVKWIRLVRLRCLGEVVDRAGAFLLHHFALDGGA